MIDISYNNSLQSIDIAASEEDAGVWPAVSRAIEENARETSVTSSRSLNLPVWEFLACRKSLSYTFQKYSLEPNVDDQVRNILVTALEKEGWYKKALIASPIDHVSLVNILKQNGFKRSLTPEQLRNIAKLASLPAGATFSVPGAGKTTEALAFYYFRKSLDSRLLVVCPKNAFAAWEEQILLCIKTPPRVVRLTGGEKSIEYILRSDPEIMLITYQQLPNVRNILASNLIKSPTFMFLDESHRIKRGSVGQWASTVLSISHLPVAKLIMSGTPLPNSVIDLVPQVNFIYPELSFEATDVKEIIQPIFVRTTKAELGLPKVQRIYTPINLKPKQRNLYELLRSEDARQLANVSSKDRSALRTVGKSVVKLLQLVSNPALLSKDQHKFPEDVFEVFSEGDSAKIEYACQRARELASYGRKTIIWSTFVENVETIAERLVDIGADYIHGGVEAGSDEEEETREWKIKKFHRDNSSYVLVANPAACSEAISLHTVCHNAIYVDRNYNVAQYLQSEDRIHRLGLSRDVITTVEILYSPDTVDESVKRRLEKKVAQMASVLNDKSLTIEPFEPELDTDGLNSEDVDDFFKHLKREK